MKILDEVKIGCYKYNVKQVPSDSQKLNYGQNLGLADYDKLEIFLSDEMNQNCKEEVYFHEILHCIDEFMNTGLDEDTVDRLGKGIYQFLQENEI